MKRFLIISILFIASLVSAGEKEYQEAWCDKANGIMEYVLDDRTRVDCLTEEYAIEFDFAKKWAEAIGQALHYSIKTGKKPGVVLIMKDRKDDKYLKRLKAVSERYDIKVWTVPVYASSSSLD